MTDDIGYPKTPGLKKAVAQVIHGIEASEEPARISSVDASLALQLQRSMERNARMANRLQRLSHAIGDTGEDAVDAAVARVRLTEIEAEPGSLVAGGELNARLARIT